MEIKFLGYHRSFDLPGAPVVWTIGVTLPFGTRKLLSVVQEEADDDELQTRAVAEGKSTWDEDTLIAHTKEKHNIDDPIVIEVLPKVPPVTP